MKLNNKTVFITGAARGFGQGLSVALAKKGCRIIGCDLAPQTDTKAKVGEAYHELIGDLSTVEGARSVTQKAIEVGFDVIINNAGIATSGGFAESDFERWRAAIDVNLTGLMAVTHTALPHLLSRSEARIVNLSSVAGCTGAPGMAAYCATKHGVAGFSKALAMELVGTSVGVTCVHPSMARTRMIDGVAEPKLLPIIQPSDVVNAIIRGIERDKAQVFVPGRMRWLTDVLPRLFPRLAFKMTLADPNAQGWLNAQKDVPPT